MKTIIRTIATLAAAGVLSVSCTMKDQDAPPLTGPSEFGTSVNVQVTPDVLQLDGASQAVVTVTVFNEAGQPLRNVPLRADILVNGQVVDFGTLSARSVVTNAEGRATLVYTAPAVASESEAVVDIAITPLGSNFQNAVARTASIRLVPSGIRIPPSNLVPSFELSPTNPAESQTVLFDASGSTGSIVQYRWDFGNGRTATERTATQAFSTAGTYVVTLTLVDAQGRTASTSRTVNVGQAPGPTAAFVFSPTDPAVNDIVHFDASASVAAPGRQIVSYRWNYGDGEGDNGRQVAHRFTQARTYTVTLTVTDDIGRTHTTSQTVTVR
ncbi:MAG TPA: PKD domain-containing protein [Vicinamibacterales bacterium]|nr:PKD domain-containing protein [Vicinamibacterales bacterium]